MKHYWESRSVLEGSSREEDDVRAPALTAAVGARRVRYAATGTHMDRRDFLQTATVGGAALGADAHSLAQHTAEDEHQAVPSDLTLRVKALESLLVEKGLVDPAALDVLIETIERKVGPHNGARLVARAWVDPAYKTAVARERPRRDRRARVHER